MSDTVQLLLNGYLLGLIGVIPFGIYEINEVNWDMVTSL